MFYGLQPCNSKQLWVPSSANLDWYQASKSFPHLEYILGGQSRRRPFLQMVL